MKILGLLGMHFDAVVVKVKTFSLLCIQIGSGHTVCRDVSAGATGVAPKF